MPAMNFAEAVCDRMNDEEDAFFVVVNDRRTFDTTPNGHMTNVQDEECVVLAATPEGGLHLRRVKDGAEISFAWHAVGSIRFTK